MRRLEQLQFEVSELISFLRVKIALVETGRVANERPYPCNAPTKIYAKGVKLRNAL